MLTRKGILAATPLILFVIAGVTYGVVKQNWGMLGLLAFLYPAYFIASHVKPR